jgi:hypothetical protein
MIRVEVQLSSEYGIMFLYDSNARPVIPASAGKKPVTWTQTCVAFSVLSYVDGDAVITLSEASEGGRCVEYFSGDVHCPSNSIALCDHNGFAFASVPLKDSFARISLRMSEETNPDIVECVIANMATF